MTGGGVEGVSWGPGRVRGVRAASRGSGARRRGTTRGPSGVESRLVAGDFQSFGDSCKCDSSAQSAASPTREAAAKHTI